MAMLSVLRQQLQCRVPLSASTAICSRLGLLRSSSERQIPACMMAGGSSAPSESVEAAGGSIAFTSRETIESHVGPISTKPMVAESAPIVLVVSGPSGVGKDAVLKALREARPDLYFVVTATSRGMRPGEVEGVDYLFITKEKFEQWLSRGELLEHAVVYGEYKGIPRPQVEEALQRGSDVVLRIDVQGARTVRKLLPEAVHIFLVAESEAELVERLVSRKTEPLDKLLVRVQTARSECKHIDEFDYVVVNREGKLEQTVAAIASVIDAEKLSLRHRSRKGPLSDL